MTAYFFSQRSAHSASIGTPPDAPSRARVTECCFLCSKSESALHKTCWPAARASAWSSLHYYRRATGRTTTIACCHAKALLAARLADMRLHHRLAH
ncbi:hypothetical protein ACU16_17975 [Xanthomonas oryzae pv. oryzicola]|nr:hypothetical protein ACU16_17975 [Xanthomonas oryzae pv. oryzicola]AKO09610.1 hypothetical protein ACU17_17830 [Xanthomonas oryzae pv. oryzicola]OWB22700.1 hypothetical protein XocBAI20_20425 [Xanthomonas oryzae pv. oryzicola]